MKALRPSSFCLLVVLTLLLASACTLTPNIKYTATLVPEPATEVPAIPTNTLAPPLPPTEVPPPPTAIPPTVVPTLAVIANGQIAYVSGGNVWRHILSSSMSIQVTTDGMAGDPATAYKNAQFSPDGRYLAYTKSRTSAIGDLVGGTVIDLSSYGEFLAWTGQGYEFFAAQGNMECPAVENLADQALLNFDVVRFNLTSLDSPMVLANVSGGLKFVSTISRDGQWASINSCGCYSECGNEQLWHLPTASIITSPPGLYPGNLDFSPNSGALTVSTFQMYGYTESPLYVGNIDMSALNPVFTETQTAPQLALWSPDGQWLAFTAITFAADGMGITESRVMLVKPDGSNLSTVQGGMAYLVDWSPDGSKLLMRQSTPSSESFYTYELSSGLVLPVPFMVDPYTHSSIDWGNLQ